MPVYGYKASAEQFGPSALLDFSVKAEAAGLEIVALSDHFQPWRHHGGHSPAALPWLGAAGQRTTTARLGTSVLTPTLRYQPAVIAQAFATLGCQTPGRVFLGVGTGEAMNETPVTGGAFPGRKERRMRLAEAIKLIRLLWSEERVDFEGEYYTTQRATVYDRPDEPVPIYVAASGPLAAKLAGRVGDGFICTSGKDPA
ncbi:MAG: LLM class flavin-dependent oxidoreductase, partial [Solirubrobacteraceae bacterium]